MSRIVKVILIFVSLFWTGSLAAQHSVTLYSIKGPSGVALIRLFEEPPRFPGTEIKLEALAQADLIAAKFISGEAKLGILPANVAAKIAAGGRRIRVAAVIGYGMLSLLSADPGVRRIEDLRGKTVEVAGQGATPDYVFRRILRARGLNPDGDLKLSYALAYPEIAQSLIAGRIFNALLPEPFATMALAGKPGIRRIGDIQAEWIAAGGAGNYPMTVLAVDADLAASSPGLVKAVLEACRSSVEWVTSHPSGAGILVEKHRMGLSAGVVSAAVPRSAYGFIPAVEARPSLEALFGAFLEYAPASIGGALPPDSFYLSW
jgi:NitT/TauT family transport system substrate-binding protein